MKLLCDVSLLKEEEKLIPLFSLEKEMMTETIIWAGEKKHLQIFIL